MHVCTLLGHVLDGQGKGLVGQLVMGVRFCNQVKKKVVANGYGGASAYMEGVVIKGLENWEMAFEGECNALFHVAICTDATSKGEGCL